MDNYKLGLSELVRGIKDGRIEVSRELAMRVNVNGYLIDTTYAYDFEEWETYIERTESGEMAIVETYKKKEEAERGHDKWVEKIKENFDIELVECRTEDQIMEWGVGPFKDVLK